MHVKYPTTTTTPSGNVVASTSGAPRDEKTAPEFRRDVTSNGVPDYTLDDDCEWPRTKPHASRDTVE
ncbi:hypothetical protein Hamer_G027227 [Homarus americanus]|uniref:Uncharacterized protein n=1 Tax=Homarus americanus TaxID=6706 RepID=A0A8J5ML70_HOMAM|nr:hypothetical protein Hamer_G028207 [Homarus americanus]KAG7155302.1 hypothetical protein Hamer_G027227 [Homarus americanus]